MIHRVLNIGRWVVDFVFAKKDYDIHGVVACLYDCGAPSRVIRQAVNHMMTCELNCGFTYANPDKHRAVVVIGPTSGGEEFTDTLVHEVHHLAVAIASDLGIDLESETPAYVAGDAARELADVICQLGCRHCHQTT